MTETATKKTFGGCAFDRTSPNKNELKASTKSLNVIVPLEEALRLHLALQDGLLKLNRYKMSATAGKRAAINMCIHLDVGRIQLLEAKV